jgi:hypothetical protein
LQVPSATPTIRGWSTPESFGKLRRLEQEPGFKFEKDVLRVGRWTLGFNEDGTPDVWDVTPQTLQDLVEAHAVVRRNGADCPLQYKHDDEPERRIGHVYQLRIEGDTLIARCSVNKEKDANDLDGSDQQVSVEAESPSFDGTGHIYPERLTHVAIVNHPVIPGQGRFKRILSLATENVPMPEVIWYAHKKGQKVRRLAVGESVKPGEVATNSETPPEDAAPADTISMIKDVVTQAAELAGIPADALPLDITDENLDDRLATILKFLKGMRAAQAGADSSVPSDLAATTEETVTQMSLPSARRQLGLAIGVIKDFRNREAARVVAEKTERKARFDARVTQLSTVGKMIPADAERIRRIAEKTDFDPETVQDLMAPYEGQKGGRVTTEKTSTMKRMSLGGAPVISEEVDPDELKTADVKTKARNLYG